MTLTELISILEDALAEHGDIPVLVPTIPEPGSVAEPMDVAVLDGSCTDPDYSQPGGHPDGLYLYIGGES
jgi:hypothetical protein